MFILALLFAAISAGVLNHTNKCILLDYFISFLGQCVVRKTIGKSIESSELGHLSKESLDKLVNDRNYCILCSVDSDTFKSKGALRFHYRLKHSKELKEMNSVFSTSVLGKRKSSSSEKTDAVQSEFFISSKHIFRNVHKLSVEIHLYMIRAYKRTASILYIILLYYFHFR